MVSTLNDTKRTAIAVKLADLKAKQDMLIFTEQQLLSAELDAESQKTIQNFLESDQKNLGILESVIVEYGVQAEPNEVTQQFVQQVKELMGGSKLSLYEKVAQYELLKHGQFMSGEIIHKAAQQVGADVLAALGPLNIVNFENRAHQEQLKGIMERVGVLELTGKEADQGLFARLQDAAAAASGVVGSVLTQTTDKQDVGIRGLIRTEHAKVNTLFTQIGVTDDPQKIQEYFGQIYKDLLTHAEAEEQVVYPAVRSFYGDSDTQELYDEQVEMKRMLDEIKSTDPASTDEFKSKARKLMDVVGDHIRQEESTMFAAIRDNCSEEQQEQMATQFKDSKSQLQKKLAGIS